MTNVKVFKSGSNLKVMRSNIFVTIERFCHKEHIYEIKKTLSLATQKIRPVLKFLKSGSNFKVRVKRSKIMAPIPYGIAVELQYKCSIL
jgi:hypothetical protein